MFINLLKILAPFQSIIMYSGLALIAYLGVQDYFATKFQNKELVKTQKEIQRAIDRINFIDKKINGITLKVNEENQEDRVKTNEINNTYITRPESSDSSGIDGSFVR